MRLIMSLNYLRCTKKQPDWMKLLSFPDVVVEKAFDKNNTKNYGMLCAFDGKIQSHIWSLSEISGC